MERGDHLGQDGEVKEVWTFSKGTEYKVKLDKKSHNMEVLTFVLPSTPLPDFDADIAFEVELCTSSTNKPLHQRAYNICEGKLEGGRQAVAPSYFARPNIGLLRHH